jgi:hypothetical protein
VAGWKKAEAKAAKQLERMQMQMTEWVRSLNVNSSSLLQGCIATCRECKLLGYLRLRSFAQELAASRRSLLAQELLHSFEYAPQLATPYVAPPSAGRRTLSCRGRPRAAHRPSPVLSVLSSSRHGAPAPPAAAERSLRRRDAPERDHRAGAGARLDSLLPGIRRGCVLARALSGLYFPLGVYAAQFKSLVARWAEEWFE